MPHERERADLPARGVKHCPTLEDQITPARVAPRRAHVLAWGDLRERLNLRLLDVRARSVLVRAVQARVFNHDDRVGARG